MSNEKDRLSGKVAAILNERELVINLGSEAGVEAGQRFAVLNPRGLNIKDPETGSELGTVEIVKVLVEVVRVKDLLAVARTFKSSERVTGGSLGVAADLFQPRRVTTVYETLKSAEHAHLRELSEEDAIVKVGDPVVLISKDEYL